jgi:hypothetical protein
MPATTTTIIITILLLIKKSFSLGAAACGHFGAYIDALPTKLPPRDQQGRATLTSEVFLDIQLWQMAQDPAWRAAIDLLDAQCSASLLLAPGLRACLSQTMDTASRHLSSQVVRLMKHSPEAAMAAVLSALPNAAVGPHVPVDSSWAARARQLELEGPGPGQPEPVTRHDRPHWV